MRPPVATLTSIPDFAQIARPRVQREGGAASAKEVAPSSTERRKQA